MSASSPAPGADRHVSERGASGNADASLWWQAVPSLVGERLGVIGNFSADTERATLAVLRSGEAVLRAHGCTLAVGPMDGNTWRRHRFVTEPGEEPPFFLEPSNPSSWPMWWRGANYTPLAEYYSTATDNLDDRDVRLTQVATRIKATGVIIRSINAGDFEAELSRIYDVSVTAFQSNYLYTPLAKDEFIAQYRMIRDRLSPELVLLAEHGGRAVGYVFATPDYVQATRQQPATTFIVKTLAVLPGRAYAGLGALLLGEVHVSARALGFKRAIHALMHETNQSRNLSAHYASTIRRYALFSKRLAS
ncbi:MAG: GNAT family N-acetyltransferase [Opitutus sp.]